MDHPTKAEKPSTNQAPIAHIGHIHSFCDFSGPLLQLPQLPRPLLQETAAVSPGPGCSARLHRPPVAGNSSSVTARNFNPADSSSSSLMEGEMQNHPLTVSSVLEYAARWHPEQGIISKTVEGPIVVSTYADLSQRAKLCAVALQRLGIRWARACRCLSAWRTFLPVTPPGCVLSGVLACRQGDVVGTLAWNTTRHLESWCAHRQHTTRHSTSQHAAQAHAGHAKSSQPACHSPGHT